MASGRTFAIGDVHGCAEELHQLLDELEITSADHLLFVGDLIDRGNGSRQVVETVLRLRHYCDVRVVLGNHEAMMLDFLRQPATSGAGMFIFNGGGATLASYADDHGFYNIPEEHYLFLESLALYHETEDYFLVHAGVPDIPLEEIRAKQYREELLWSRTIRKSAYSWSKLIVHGHTQRPEVEIAPNRINVDAGCVYGGCLAAIDLDSQKVYYVERRSPEEMVHLSDRSSRRKAVRFDGQVPVRIQRDGRWNDFVTDNYSEVGIYIRPADDTVEELEIGETISGRISPADKRAVEFSGEVVRIDKGAATVRYGVRIVLVD